MIEEGNKYDHYKSEVEKMKKLVKYVEEIDEKDFRKGIGSLMDHSSNNNYILGSMME
jgi:hypothetical protein